MTGVTFVIHQVRDHLGAAHGTPWDKKCGRQRILAARHRLSQKVATVRLGLPQLAVMSLEGT
jgi:hypothetical protein